jgi:SAM-dependent methyltransferase
VVRGVPRLLPAHLRASLTRDFLRAHAADERVRGLRGDGPDRPAISPALGAVQRATQTNFGFEWTAYARHGWDDPVHHLAHEEAVFRHKSLLEPAAFDGKLVLDAGCGNGRYSYWAARWGARVIGLDLTAAVESARRNTGEVEAIQIVQGDLFDLPFADETFDIIYSIGVLMHTGDAARATASLARKLRPGGSLTAHLYGRGNLVYETVDRLLRAHTTRLSIPELERFTRGAWSLRRLLDRLHLARLAVRFVRLDPHPHCIFDWYAAPVASHHTYEEVRRWFAELGLAVVGSNEEVSFGPPPAARRPAPAGPLRRGLRSIAGSATTVTLRGVKPSPVRAVRGTPSLGPC